MNTWMTLSLLALASTFSAPNFAADGHAAHGMAHAEATPISQWADGLVKKVDRNAGKLTLAHGALVNLAMPPMTMVFGVQQSAWLKTLKAGDKIRFIAEEVNGALVVTHLETAR